MVVNKPYRGTYEAIWLLDKCILAVAAIGWYIAEATFDIQASAQWCATMAQVLVTLLVAIAVERDALPAADDETEFKAARNIAGVTVAALVLGAAGALESDASDAEIPGFLRLIAVPLLMTEVFIVAFLLMFAFQSHLRRRDGGNRDD
jgi:hypothetical protein